MTFKHVKFQDSAVMRSLERVAQEKGLVKEEDLVKTASLSKKADLTPSDNLLENLLKLSAGLRESGFSKYADELEDRAFAYKQAQTLYETSKEKGEDLVDAAHPNGSHKLEDVDGDELATVETIIDQQLKDLEMIEKKPTGKLASSKDILKAVMMVLADGAPSLDQIKGTASEAAKVIKTIANLVNDELTFSISPWIGSSQKHATNPTVYNLKEFRGSISRLHDRLDPSFSSKWRQLGIGGVSDYTWTRIQPLFGKAIELVNKAIDLRIKFDDAEQSTLEGRQPAESKKEVPVANPVADKIRSAKMSLNGIAALVKADTTADPTDVKDVTAWITRIDSALKELETQSANMNPADVDAALAKLTKDFARVRQEWS